MWWQDTQTRQQQAISKIKEMIYSCSIGWMSMNIVIKLQIKKLLKISEEYFGEKYWSSCSGDSAFLPTPATDPTKYPSCVTSVPAVFFRTVNLKKITWYEKSIICYETLSDVGWFWLQSIRYLPPSVVTKAFHCNCFFCVYIYI